MRVHFISIGGSVMHQLAIALKKKGYNVTGSDDEIFEPSRTNLENEGLLPKVFGWFTENITTDLDAVILGMHAKADNPELQEAQKLGLKIYSFPEYIFNESKNKTRVIVGGSHGKTTTTSMIMHVLNSNNKSFDYLVGAKLQGFEQSVNITDAPVIVCEGDEYPASTLEKRPKFHFLFPHIAILTGIAWDHINVFPTFDFYKEQFIIFINKIEKGGVLIYNETDEVLKELVETDKREDIKYIPYKVPEHSIENGKTTVTIDGATTTLKVFGAHNLLNLNAAWLVCKELGLSANDFTNAIKEFTGAAKRLEILAANETTNIYRDFAHAPSKVVATIDALKKQFPERKLIAVLELHTFSSLNANFMHEYKGALDNADVAIVYYSKHALELKRMPDLEASTIISGFANDNIVVMNNKTELENFINNQPLENTTLAFMSSGNYDGLDVVTYANELINK